MLWKPLPFSAQHFSNEQTMICNNVANNNSSCLFGDLFSIQGDVESVIAESEANVAAAAAAPKGQKVTKKKSTASTKTAAATTRPRRGRSVGAKPKEEEKTTNKSVVPSRSKSSSKAGGGKKKDGEEKKKTKKAAGVKRENNDDGRGAKRTKTEPVIEKRTTRSRSRASRRSAISEEAATRKPEELKIVTPSDDKHIVPLDFRLHRESFDGKNFTDGIAHYDAARRSDPQKVTEYITDLFQHLYKAEVRYSFFLSIFFPPVICLLNLIVFLLLIRRNIG